MPVALPRIDPVLRGAPVDAAMQPPALAPGLVERSRLLGHLSESSARVALVVAPAGFGKTTVLAQWAAIDDRPVGWLLLSESDNDPSVLLARLLVALDAVGSVTTTDFEAIAMSAADLPAGRAPEARGARPRSAAVPSRVRRRPSPPCICGGCRSSVSSWRRCLPARAQRSRDGVHHRCRSRAGARTVSSSTSNSTTWPCRRRRVRRCSVAPSSTSRRVKPRCSSNSLKVGQPACT